MEKKTNNLTLIERKTMEKNIAALTKYHNDKPGFISINQKDHGEVEISIREDGDCDKYCILTLTSDEFKQLVSEIILNGIN